MKITKKYDTGATASDLKIKIRQTRLRMIIWPAVMFAKRRIIRANGFENIPMISTGIIMGNSQNGTPGCCKNMSSSSVLLPLNCVIKNVNRARTNVTAIFPVTFAPKGGGKGISPIQVIHSMKKKHCKEIGHIFFILVFTNIR